MNNGKFKLRGTFNMQKMLSLVVIFLVILVNVIILVAGKCETIYLKPSKIEEAPKLDDDDETMYLLEYRYKDNVQSIMVYEDDLELKGLRVKFYYGLDYFADSDRDMEINRLLIKASIIGLIIWVIIFLKDVKREESYIGYTEI